MTAPGATEFDRATAVSPLGNVAWGAACDVGWFAGRGPNGGYLAAIVLRAMSAELADPAREPRSLTCPAPWVRLHEPVSAPTIDLTVHFRGPDAAEALAPDEPVLAVVRSTTAADGFFEEDGELWTRDGVLLAQSRQLALLNPLAPAAA